MLVPLGEILFRALRRFSSGMAKAFTSSGMGWCRVFLVAGLLTSPGG